MDQGSNYRHHQHLLGAIESQGPAGHGTGSAIAISTPPTALPEQQPGALKGSFSQPQRQDAVKQWCTW